MCTHAAAYQRYDVGEGLVSLLHSLQGNFPEMTATEPHNHSSAVSVIPDIKFTTTPCCDKEVMQFGDCMLGATRRNHADIHAAT